MTWIKDVYLDFVVLLIISVFAYSGGNILYVVLWVYSGLLLLSKILALFMPALKKKADKTNAPPYIYHGIYGLTVGILAYAGNYYLAGTWAVIWGLSFYDQLEIRAKSKSTP